MCNFCDVAIANVMTHNEIKQHRYLSLLNNKCNVWIYCRLCLSFLTNTKLSYFFIVSSLHCMSLLNFNRMSNENIGESKAEEHKGLIDNKNEVICFRIKNINENQMC